MFRCETTTVLQLIVLAQALTIGALGYSIGIKATAVMYDHYGAMVVASEANRSGLPMVALMLVDLLRKTAFVTGMAIAFFW